MMKIQYQFKTKALAEQYLKERGWYKAAYSWLNDRFPGQTREIIKVASHWEIKP